jgi:hypothetical protein
VVRIGISNMRSTKAPRSSARRPDDAQPTAIFGAMGMIATLVLLWAGIAASLPG